MKTAVQTYRLGQENPSKNGSCMRKIVISKQSHPKVIQSLFRFILWLLRSRDRVGTDCSLWILIRSWPKTEDQVSGLWNTLLNSDHGDYKHLWEEGKACSCASLRNWGLTSAVCKRSLAGHARTHRVIWPNCLKCVRFCEEVWKAKVWSCDGVSSPIFLIFHF